MTTLKSQGQRFMVSPDGRDADWFHPAELPAGWTDCTGMDDGEFNHFMAERRSIYPPIAA